MAPSPIHGPLNAGQSIVYILDASGSMGEWGKFDKARKKLIATLQSQRETVSFQVVIYTGALRLTFSRNKRRDPNIYLHFIMVPQND